MLETIVLTAIVVLIVGLNLYFLGAFVRPWRQLRAHLDRAVSELDALHADVRSTGDHARSPKAVDEILAPEPRLKHIWDEFRDTLHAERLDHDFDDDGQPRVHRYRQTLPAETFFSGRSVIDVPLRTGFFRHLPGILTGLGILGTFSGLIDGLASFTISGSTDTVNSSVRDLVDAVRIAFFVSAGAIFLAMVVTFSEKQAVAGLADRLQQLQSGIDRLFDAGAGEDYLSSIASETEKSAVQLAQLKDGLVNDLRLILEEVTERQVNAHITSVELLAGRLEKPMNRMEETLANSVRDQQRAVHQLLDSSLEAFAVRLEEVIGEKLTSAAQEIRESAELLQAALIDAPERVQDAVERVRAVLDDLAGKVETMTASATRIDAATTTFAGTIEQSTETLDYAIDRFRALGGELVASLEHARTTASAMEKATGHAQKTATALNGVHERIDAATAALRTVIEALDGVTARTEQDAAAQSQLADAVRQAADQLARAQKDVDGFLKGLEPALTETQEAFAHQLNATLEATHETFHRHMSDATRTLAGTVEQFDSFLSTDFSESVEDLRKVIDRMGEPPANGTKSA